MYPFLNVLYILNVRANVHANNGYLWNVGYDKGLVMGI